MGAGEALIVPLPDGARWDISAFESGEILVCDAIQPTMTHLVPIAGGIPAGG